MRSDLVESLLDRELEVCDLPSLRGRGVDVWREASDVFIKFEHGRDGAQGMFRLGCSSFDAQPPSVAMVDAETREDLPIERWVPGVAHSVHPTLSRPFVCIQGTLEYHLHPSHLDDSWDRYRHLMRLPQTINRLLEKAGVP